MKVIKRDQLAQCITLKYTWPSKSENCMHGNLSLSLSQFYVIWFVLIWLEFRILVLTFSTLYLLYHAHD